MASFLSDMIQSIFCQYDDHYISPSVKRFLRECIIQLITVSINSMVSPLSSSTVTHGAPPMHLHSNPNHHSHSNSNFNNNPQHNLDKQLSLLTEWLENFVEPAHISMYTHTMIHIMRQFQSQHDGDGHGVLQRKHARDQSRASLSMTNQLESGAMTTTMASIEETPRNLHKRLSLFARNSNSHHHHAVTDGMGSGQHLAPYSEDDDVKMEKKRNSLTAGSTISTQDLRVNTDLNASSKRLELSWTEYENLSMILIRSLTSMLRRLQQRYQCEISVIFDDQIDHILDDIL